MAKQCDYPPEVFGLQVDAIPLLCRSKQDVVLLFQGPGVAPEDIVEVSRTLRLDQALDIG